MADQDDFTFDEQDDDSEEWSEEESDKKGKGGWSRRRLMLLLLLLVVIAAGGYYYTMMPPDDGPTAPPKAVVKVEKKPIAIPAKPEQKKSAPVQQLENSPEPVNPQKSIPVTGQQAGKKTDVAADGAETASGTVQSTPSEMSPGTTASEEEKAISETAEQKTAEPATSPQVFETSTGAKPEAAQPAGAYSLTAGTYLLDSSVKSVSGKIRAFGYKPVTHPVKRKVSMTRLKVGTFPVPEAERRKAELKSIAPGVFGITEGDTETVYAGSFLILDKARRYADKLYVQGIKLEEVPVEVEQTLHRVTFGSFATKDAAREAARQAAADGVEAKVIKNR